MRMQGEFDAEELVSRGKESISNYGALLREKLANRKPRRRKNKE